MMNHGLARVFACGMVSLLAMGVGGCLASDADVEADNTESSATNDADQVQALSTAGNAAVAEARKYLGIHERAGDCNQFSDALGAGCHEWCSDFVRYVWGRVGADTGGLTAYSGTFHDYGLKHGTWKPASSIPQPGDAVIWGTSDFGWSAHVGMVTAVSGSSFRIINGNFDVGSGGQVFETDFVNSSYDAGTGYPMLGFASPSGGRVPRVGERSNGSIIQSIANTYTTLGGKPGDPDLSQSGGFVHAWPDNTGCETQNFAGTKRSDGSVDTGSAGILMFNPRTGQSRWVRGQIFKQYVGMNTVGLGCATGDEQAFPEAGGVTGYRQRFENGTVTWDHFIR